MEPVSTITSFLTITKTATEISRKLYEITKGLKDRDLKQQIDEITDKVRELKHSASQLEDENRDLREKLRFKSDNFVFHNPFYYDKALPDQPLCAKCFSNKVVGPMGRPGHDCNPNFRKCLVCGNFTLISLFQEQNTAP